MRQFYSRRAHGTAIARSAIADSASARLGLTLIEMLVALAVTLIIMAAVTEMFGRVTTSIGGARATIETGERLRRFPVFPHKVSRVGPQILEVACLTRRPEDIDRLGVVQGAQAEV